MQRLCLILVCLASTLHAAKKTPLPIIEKPFAPLEAAKTMQVPKGFEVTLFAGEPGIKQPIGFCIDDRGRLWVAEANNYPDKKAGKNDRIIILEDTDGDGTHDKRIVFYDKIEYICGIEVGFGGAWVMSLPNLYFIPDKNYDGVPDGEPVVLLDGFGTDNSGHNIANGLAWGPDGWLYNTHGCDNWSLLGKPGTRKEKRRRFDGGVWRYHPTRHVWEPYATGMVNPWGIDWNDYGQAFVCNCVTPHLYHIIQGAYYDPLNNRPTGRYSYERITTIADHRHGTFVRGGNFRPAPLVPTAVQRANEFRAGGGHAHCGAMVYLGDNWPSKYRNQIFLNNVHGRRINNDRLTRKGSGYTASHEPDVMIAADPWFVGVSLAYGPDGAVYISDFSDTGECHHYINTQKHTGRIFKIAYGKPKTWQGDLNKLSNEELLKLNLHKNDWFVRHARRILQERQADTSALVKTLKSDLPLPSRLRALWALHVSGHLHKSMLSSLLDDSSEHIRAWAIQLLCENRKPGVAVCKKLAQLAKNDKSPLVRLYLASAMQRLSFSERTPILKRLLAHAEDVKDQNLPLMYWYATEPVVVADKKIAIELLTACKIPKVRQFITRRLTSN